jgi:hypothetical protein
MMLCAVNRSQPAFTSRNPQFITRREVRGRVVEGADSKFNLVDAVYARKTTAWRMTAPRPRAPVSAAAPMGSVMSLKIFREPASRAIAGNLIVLAAEISDLDGPAPRAHTQSIWREVIR